LLSKNTTPLMLTVLVRPGFGVVVFLHDLIVKNSPSVARSAAMAAGVSCVSANSNPASLHMPRNNFGVMARCRFGAGSALAKALKRERAEGSSWDECWISISI
jgi:hypothetical protein